jgi:hypothetical protein
MKDIEITEILFFPFLLFPTKTINDKNAYFFSSMQLLIPSLWNVPIKVASKIKHHICTMDMLDPHILIRCGLKNKYSFFAMKANNNRNEMMWNVQNYSLSAVGEVVLFYFYFVCNFFFLLSRRLDLSLQLPL